MRKLFATICLLFVGLPMAHAQDWSGAYGMLGVSTVNGDLQNFDLGVPTNAYDLSGRLVTLAVGYNLQRGNLVYGAELAYSSGDTAFDLSSPNYLDGMIDLKGRLGYAAGKLLWYGTLGYARSDRTYGGLVTNDPLKTDGISFGLGVEMMVSDRVLVGVDVLQRNLSVGEGDIGGFPDASTDYKLTSVGLRIGFRFWSIRD